MRVRFDFYMLGSICASSYALESVRRQVCNGKTLREEKTQAHFKSGAPGAFFSLTDPGGGAHYCARKKKRRETQARETRSPDAGEIFTAGCTARRFDGDGCTLVAQLAAQRLWKSDRWHIGLALPRRTEELPPDSLRKAPPSPCTATHPAFLITHTSHSQSARKQRSALSIQKRWYGTKSEFQNGVRTVSMPP